MSENAQIVYVVDDDPVFSQTIEETLRFGGYQVECWGSAEDLLENLPTPTRGCILLDLRLKGMSGLEFLRDCVPRPVSIPVLVLTGNADVPRTVQAMRAGAVDVIEKPFDDEGLKARVQRALELEAEQWERNIAVHEARRTLESLTLRERQVLQKLAHGLSNRDVGLALGISPRTIEVHRGRIMGKFKCDTMTGLVRKLVECGVHRDLDDAIGLAQGDAEGVD